MKVCLTLRSLLFVLAAIVAGCGRPSPAGSLPALTRMLEVNKLSATQAALGYPVKLRGVVTFYDPAHRLLTVQDRTGGLPVDARDITVDHLMFGVEVDLSGWTAVSNSTPIIVKPRLTTRGAASLPEPHHVGLQEVSSGRLDFQWVQIEGVATSIDTIDNAHVRVGLEQGGQTLEIYLSSEAFLNRAIIGSRIQVRGVPSTFRDPMRRRGKSRLHVPDFRLVTSPDLDVTAKAPAPAPPSSPKLTLTSAQAVKQLSPALASQRFPVKLRAVVNCYQPVFGGLFVQDSTGGIYVNLVDGPDLKLPVGGEVEVTGVSSPCDFAPCIVDATARHVGAGVMFPPLQIQNPDKLAMDEENRWSHVEGIARGIRHATDLGVTVELNVAGRLFGVFVTGDSDPHNYAGWIDSELAIDGVLSPNFDTSRRLREFKLVSPGRQFVRVATAAPKDPFAGKPQPLAGLHQFQPGTPTAHRVKVAGTVSSLWNNSRVTIADGDSALELQAAESFDLELGDAVEAVGFLRLDGWQRGLVGVRARKTGKGTPALPRDFSAEDVLIGAEDVRLVRVEAVLVNQERLFGDLLLTMSAEDSRFTAVLEQPQLSPRLANLREGSILRLTGVCQMDWDRSRTPPRPRGFQLLLRQPEDVEVVQQASWWTFPRVLSVLACVGVVLILALGWVAALRSRVRRQTAQIAEQAEQSRQLEAQLARAQKLESVGRLAGGIAHDFNNMLTVINGYSNLLQSQPDLNATARFGLTEIAKAGHRAASLTQQMLAFGRRQMLQPVVLDLNEVICGMEAIVRRVVSEQIEFSLQMSTDLGLVKADSGQIQQVLLNLVVNARDAMPAGGRLVIQTKNLEIAEPFVENDEEVQAGSFVAVAVIDSGQGIDPETFKRIFEPFFTTKPVGAGTGLGLSTVFGIVKQSGGHLHVESEPGSGARFEVRLPRIAGESGPAAAPAGETVLLVAEQQEVRHMVKETLSAAGYQVLEAAGGASALEVLQQHRGPAHLLLADVALAGVDGPELARRVSGFQPNLRVLFLSGYAEVPSGSVLVDGAALECLQKPFAPRTLLARVRAALD